MNKLYIVFFFIFSGIIFLKAQNCDFVFEKNEKIERFTEGYVKNFSLYALPRAVVKIPVVVHVVWRTAEENISDAQILSQIEVLNQDFRKKNTDAKDVPGVFKTVAADCEIEFCLAQRDTLGKITTGITRKQTTADNVGTAFSNNRRRIYYNDIGGTQNWKPQQYLNIWVCKMESIFGYTTSLVKALETPSEDGIVVDYRVFGTIGTAANTERHKKGRTAAHEIGHYFNLLHIWGNDNTCNDDDLVDDTPKQDSAYFGCPSFPQLSCGVGNMYMNFMDYTNDECMGLFTNGQKARMLATLMGFRSGLLSGAGCEPSPTQDIDFPYTVYPNPVQDVLKISFKNAGIFSSKTVQLMDAFGRVLIEKKDINTVHGTPFGEGGVEIPMNGFPNGFYTLLLRFDNQILVSKLVLAH
jgi:Pregnancy-associated plasma protein-A/Secretion system C-terminal sorting domain